MKCEQRNALYLHFTMEDNPSLSARIRQRYRSSYSGAFYRRFILGEWTAAKGLVYDFFDPARDAVPRPGGKMEQYVISVDYGTANPCSSDSGAFERASGTGWRSITTHPGAPACS